ncbi:unnamed protein product [Prunus armeniaca]|uniref:Alpha-1,3-glucosyltransferase n=1 Tax=Prunus armeniaca TaxID=36596 RepID=A0A6J5WI42_PRUAR|nr:unnamed protein product [Prunus armeniaca]
MERAIFYHIYYFKICIKPPSSDNIPPSPLFLHGWAGQWSSSPKPSQAAVFRSFCRVLGLSIEVEPNVETKCFNSMEAQTTPKLKKPPKPSKPITELWWFFAAAACVKLLLIPAYKSTDFEGLDYSSNTALYFQRISVIFSDLCLLHGIYRLTRKLDSTRQKLIWVLVVWSPMLVIVDHLHFQYNGFLLGILLISLSYLEEGRDVMGGLVFAVLLCFKHLFAVAAPVYFVYLLRHYCWKGFVRGFWRLFILGVIVVAVFAVAYGPFVYHGQMQQVIHRMFPFGRGLCHAYWAPNFWVFYIILDKVLAFLLGRLGFNIQAPAASFTGGIVGDLSPFAVLPQITPVTTFILVLLALSPCLIKAWRHPRPVRITRWVAYAYTCGFLFGWHVHEKAALHFVIPLAIVAVQSLDDSRHYFLLSTVSCYSLFPLLFEAQEYPIKVLLLLLHSMLMWLGFSAQFTKRISLELEKSEKKKDKEEGFVIGWVGWGYLVGILLVEISGQFLHPIIFGDKLPFIPLMLSSTYCALGTMYSFIWQLKWILDS